MRRKISPKKTDSFFIDERTLMTIVDLAKHPAAPTGVRHAAAALLVEVAHTLNHLLIDDPDAEVLDTAMILSAFSTRGSW